MTPLFERLDQEETLVRGELDTLREKVAAAEERLAHSASLLVAASRRHRAGHLHACERVSRRPQLALGPVLDTPGKRIGPNAVHSLTQLAPFGFPKGLLAADRAYTDEITEHFAQPVRTLGRPTGSRLQTAAPGHPGHPPRCPSRRRIRLPGHAARTGPRDHGAQRQGRTRPR
ncbi:hypothetical protein [Streptomyces sp. NPDC060198]|uniref:hypothetical protein n=1 Tax=Streptomyces sp. NPDC060198 TaxID=3347070 RepID=UPI00365B012A